MKQFPISDSDQSRIEALVSHLDRSLSALIGDIRVEEERVGVIDVSSPMYPTTLAQHLRARHDNLTGTIDVLRSRLTRGKGTPDGLIRSSRIA